MRALVLAGVLSMLAGLLVAPAAAARAPESPAAPKPNSAPTTTADPAAQKDANADKRAGLNAEIDALRASDAEMRTRISEISGQLDAKKAELASASATADQANAGFVAAQAAVVAARAEADRTEGEVRQMAIDAYLNPPSEVLALVLVSSSIEEASRRRSVLTIRAQQRAVILDERRVALAQQEQVEGQARTAKETADQARDAQQAVVTSLEQQRKQQASFAAAIDSRLDASLAESASLQALDAKLAKEIADRDLALKQQAESLGVTAPPPPPPPPTTVPPKTNAPLPPVPRPAIPTVDVVNVGGFVVSVAIAPQVRALLDAFAPTGHQLGGGAYRDPASQISLRAAHCGPTYYDIYLKPSSQCSPPTARPGSSMHELGMAIDFTCDGTLINSHDNFCFIWLAANAANYGLYNLPSEPWHWSTNGN